MEAVVSAAALVAMAAVSVVVDTNRRIEEINQLSQEVDFSSENEKEEWAPEGADDFDYAYDD